MTRMRCLVKRARTASAPLAIAAGLCVTFTGILSPVVKGETPRFFQDDPLWTEPNSQDASKVQPWDIGLIADLTLNQFGRPGDPTPNVRAQNVNTVDEVSDGSWYTNRAGHLPLTADDVATGPDVTSGPPPGTWTVTSAKTDGITPGFTIEDATGQKWFLKFDPPGFPAMATGTEVAVTKLLWTLGYHVPENHIAALRREQLVIGGTATIRLPGREKRAMRLSDIDDLLAHADRHTDGSFRVIASRALDGKPLGGFRFYGTRPDDPNDIVPHEHRRELRGYGVFSAWLNHVDAKSINTMDTLVTKDGRSMVRHHLLDFGSTLGSGGVAPREHWEGFEHIVEPRDVAKQMVSFGFAVPAWRRMAFCDHPAIGRLPLDNGLWRPDQWKPRVPNPAFLRARPDDRFWAATKLAAISNEMIHAAIGAGQFGDEEAERFLARALIERRDAILRTYLPAINPVIQPELSGDGTLTFANAAVDARVARPPAQYRVTWAAFDNATRISRVLGETTANQHVKPPAGLPRESGAFVKAAISATGGAPQSWERPVDAYFQRTVKGWKLVGLDRLPDQTGT